MSNPLYLAPPCLKHYNFDIIPDHGEYPELVIKGLTKEQLQETKDIILENQFKAFKYEKLKDEIQRHIHDYKDTVSSTSLDDLREIMDVYL